MLKNFNFQISNLFVYFLPSCISHRYRQILQFTWGRHCHLQNEMLYLQLARCFLLFFFFFFDNKLDATRGTMHGWHAEIWNKREQLCTNQMLARRKIYIYMVSSETASYLAFNSPLLCPSLPFGFDSFVFPCRQLIKFKCEKKGEVFNPH